MHLVAQTRALRWVSSVTVNVSFFMGSHSGGAGGFQGRPIYINCAPDDGYFLQMAQLGRFPGLKSASLGTWQDANEKPPRLRAAGRGENRISGAPIYDNGFQGQCVLV